MRRIGDIFPTVLHAATEVETGWVVSTRLEHLLEENLQVQEGVVSRLYDILHPCTAGGGEAKGMHEGEGVSFRSPFVIVVIHYDQIVVL